MTFAEQMMLIGALVQALGFSVVILNQLRNRTKESAADATTTAAQFTALDKACSASIAALRNELLSKIDHQSSNLGNVVSNIGNRIHDVELKAAEARALAAENISSVSSNLREEFRRDVREETNELRVDMQASFHRLEAVVDNMAASLARGMLGLAVNGGS